MADGLEGDVPEFAAFSACPRGRRSVFAAQRSSAGRGRRIRQHGIIDKFCRARGVAPRAARLAFGPALPHGAPSSLGLVGRRHWLHPRALCALHSCGPRRWRSCSRRRLPRTAMTCANSEGQLTGRFITFGPRGWPSTCTTASSPPSRPLGMTTPTTGGCEEPSYTRESVSARLGQRWRRRSVRHGRVTGPSLLPPRAPCEPSLPPPLHEIDA